VYKGGISGLEIRFGKLWILVLGQAGACKVRVPKLELGNQHKLVLSSLYTIPGKPEKPSFRTGLPDKSAG